MLFQMCKERHRQTPIKLRTIVVIVAVLLFGNFFSETHVLSAYEAKAPAHIKKPIWKSVLPYLLPETHPAKPKLDAIFSSQRALLNLKTLEKAGFRNPKPRKYTHLIVTSHPDLEGYVIKLYVDAQRYYKDTPEWKYWILRIQGAHAIEHEIQRRGLQEYFKVPKKWIYAVPGKPQPSEEYLTKNFILIEEDMDLCTSKMNHSLWKGSTTDKELLQSLYSLLEDLGLKDCAKPDNVPFSIDGKIAFIDTQTWGEWPVLYEKLTPFLSKEMKAHWKKLTKGAR
jgi:hypothetical protein